MKKMFFLLMCVSTFASFAMWNPEKPQESIIQQSVKNMIFRVRLAYFLINKKGTLFCDVRRQKTHADKWNIVEQGSVAERDIYACAIGSNTACRHLREQLQEYQEIEDNLCRCRAKGCKDSASQGVPLKEDLEPLKKLLDTVEKQKKLTGLMYSQAYKSCMQTGTKSGCNVLVQRYKKIMGSDDLDQKLKQWCVDSKE